MIDRYSLSKMSRIWSDEHKMEIMLKIEVLSCEAMTKLGLSQGGHGKDPQERKFDLEEVRRLEERTKHDVVAFIQSVGQSWDRKLNIYIWNDLVGSFRHFFVLAMCGSR